MRRLDPSPPRHPIHPTFTEKIPDAQLSSLRPRHLRHPGVRHQGGGHLPLEMYYNPAVFSLWKLNNLLPHVRPRILKQDEAEEVLRHGFVGFGRCGSKILNPESWLRNGGHSTQDQVMQMGRRLSQGRPSQSQPEPFRDFNMVATNKGTLDPESTINTGESKRRIGLQ